MKKLFALLCLLPILSHAATVAGDITDVGLVKYGTYVRFQPLSTPLANGNSTVLDVPKRFGITNGAFSAELVGGFYNADFGSPNALIRILVPTNSGTITFNECAQLAVNAGMFGLNDISVNVITGSAIAAGTNITAQTNGSLVTINASVPSGVLTNGGDATLNNLTASTINASGNINLTGAIHGGSFAGSLDVTNPIMTASQIYGDRNRTNAIVINENGLTVSNANGSATIQNGVVTANGSGLNSLNASALTTGTVSLSRLPTLDNAHLPTGVLTNTQSSVTLGAPLSVTSSYGVGGNTVRINGNTYPSMDSWQGYMRLLSDVSGLKICAPDSTVWATFNGKQLNGYTYDGSGPQPFGAQAQNSLGVIGGEGSALSGIPLEAQVMWKAGIQDPQVYATVWWDYQTNLVQATYWTNLVQRWATNGMYQTVTNLGLKPWLMLDSIVYKTHDASGNLVENTAQFPSGVANFVTWAHSQGYLVEIGMYYSGDITNRFDVPMYGYESAKVTDPNTLMVACSTPLTVSRDVVTLYNTGADSVRVADYQPQSGLQQTGGYQLQSIRQWAYYIQYPNGMPWSKDYSHRLGLSWFLGETPFMINDAVFANQLNSDQFISSPLTGEIADQMEWIRRDYTNTLWASGRGHFMSLLISAAHSGSDTLKEWKACLSVGAMVNSLIQFDTLSANWKHQVFTTNVTYQAVKFDRTYHPAWRKMDDGRNSVWVKPVGSGQYAILVANQSTTNTTFTLTTQDLNPPGDWNPIQTPPRLDLSKDPVFRAVNIWAQTNYSLVSQASPLTVTVGPDDIFFTLLKPVYYYDNPAYSLAGQMDRLDGDGEAPFYVSDERRWVGDGLGYLRFLVPPWTTNMTVQFRQFTTIASLTYTNLMSPQYVVGATRHWNDGGVSQVPFVSTASSAGISNVTVTATWPVTSQSANKWCVMYVQPTTNAAYRCFVGPFRIICE